MQARVQWEVNTIVTAEEPLRQSNNVGMLLIFITMRALAQEGREGGREGGRERFHGRSVTCVVFSFSVPGITVNPLSTLMPTTWHTRKHIRRQGRQGEMDKERVMDRMPRNPGTQGM